MHCAKLATAIFQAEFFSNGLMGMLRSCRVVAVMPHKIFSPKGKKVHAGWPQG
jgi:hypothetical protein